VKKNLIDTRFPDAFVWAARLDKFGGR